MENTLLKGLWEREIIILDEFVRICKKHNLEYYLMWGTLIGAVRHKGFIPWDDDIDVSMPREDYKKFLKVAPAELDAKFFLQHSKTDKFHPVAFAKLRLNNTAFYEKGDNNFKRHRGIFIDIIPLDNRKRKVSIIYKIRHRIANTIKTHIINKRQGHSTKRTWYLNIFTYGFLTSLRDRLFQGKGDCYVSWGYVFDKQDFAPAIQMEFEGKTYAVPRNYDKVLTTIYGDYMSLPPEDQRIAHLPEFISFDLENDKEAKKYGQ